MLPTHFLETSPGFGDNNMLTQQQWLVYGNRLACSSLRKKVTVDVGTGYYIEMSVERAHKFCSRTATAQRLADASLLDADKDDLFCK